MAFIDENLMADKMDELSAKPHPMLSQAGLAASVKATYLQGCVLAALVDDAKVDRDERRKLRALGLSLGLLGSDIDDFIQTVQELKTSGEQNDFINELKRTVQGYPLVESFMADFQEILKKEGEIPESSRKFLDFIGAQLLGEPDWEQALKDRKAERKRKADAERRRREQEAERRRQAEEAHRQAEAKREAERKKDEIREQIKKKQAEYDELEELTKMVIRVNEREGLKLMRERDKVKREIDELKKKIGEDRPAGGGLFSFLSGLS